MPDGQVFPQSAFSLQWCMPARDPILGSADASESPTTQYRASVHRYTGEVVYIYTFDIAYEMVRQPITTLMGQSVSQFAVDVSKRSPRSPFFYRSQTVALPGVERMSPRGLLRLQRSVKILPVGAISITLRIPFEVDSLGDLVPYHDLKLSDGRRIHDEARDLAEQVRKELAPYLIRPVATLGDEEAYTVFCFDAPLIAIDGQMISGADWLLAHRRGIAALLTEETAPENLSDQEAEESTNRYLSYYEKDLVVVDWDAAIIIDEPRFRDEVLYIMELANIQLAELESYDALLDAAVERSYRDVADQRFRRFTGHGVQRSLQELRIDMARLSDELSNITKFFGDWHLARIFQLLSDRFHLGDWHRTTDEKLKTLDELYQLLRADQNNRLMLILEATVVVIFVIDVLLLVFHKI